MKKLLIILLSALSLTALAQKPKLAVYMTGDDPINEIVSNRLVDDFAHSNEYTIVERTASFLAELKKEHAYERAGDVDDEQIAALGRQFKVQYVCVISVLDIWGSEKYITARIIDAETGEVVASCSSNGSVQNRTELIGALNTLSNDFSKAVGSIKQNDAKKVAVYVTKTGNRDVDVVLGDQLVSGFARSGRYVAIERTNGFLRKLKEEQGYQESGAVNDEDLTRWGKQFGVQYVCVIKSTPWSGDYYITTRMIDVKTGEVVNSYKVEGRTLSNSRDVVKVAQEIAAELSKGTIAEQAEEARLEKAKREEAKREEERRKAEEEARKPHNYTETAYGINMKMIWVEGGEFLMGCTSEQSDCNDNEKNVRRVTIDGYYIGMLEVTQAQWAEVMGTSISEQGKKDWRYKNKEYRERGVGDYYPMYFVSWDEAMEFCKKMSEKSGKTYTLPTEAQWEYAARGGINANGTQYAGSNYVSAVAWCGDENGSTHLCGTKQANSLGIYDMSGNVEEWCKDWYSDSYLSYDTKNPQGPSSGKDFHVVRGGNWHYRASYCRVSARGRSVTWNRLNYLGFRVVCIP